MLLLDYPSIGRSRDIAPEALTADRVCADLLGVADAAGCERFAYWGYSWGGNVGLQLATR
ncbi:MAG: alpha/beta fold hydrolase, partial [Betaproteobacteria bacterium]